MKDKEFDEKAKAENIEAEDIDPEAVENFDAVESGDEEETLNPEVIESTPESEIAELKAQVEKEKKEYLFLMAEFDNFRKRTLKEKSEIIKNAGEQVLKGLLPIVDDFERGLKAAGNAGNADDVTKGMELIYNKLIKYLAQNGVKAIDPEERDFDTERHEAISVVPVPDEAQKGKILDTVEKGYMINDKVLRHAKVVVGQ